MAKAANIFYGWVIVGIATLVFAIVRGVNDSFSIFFVALLEEFGWGRAAGAGVFSCARLTEGTVSVGVGILSDRFGLRRLVPMSACLVAPGKPIRPLAGHGGNLVVDIPGQLPSLGWLQIIAEERRMDRDHLHVYTLRVHVLEALCRCEAQFGCLDGTAFVVTDGSAQAGPWLIADAVPRVASVNGLPETLRHQRAWMSMVRMDPPPFHAKPRGGFRDSVIFLNSSRGWPLFRLA